MTENYFDPIMVGESNSPDTVNTRLGDLDAAIAALDVSVQDELDAIIIGSGTSPAEVIAARTGLRYAISSPPATLGATVGLLAANTIHVDAYGAVGNGTTNDAVAIQAALNAAGAGDTVLFSAGKVYKLTAGVTLSTDKVIIMGYGATINSNTLDADALTVSGHRCAVVGLSFLGIDNTALTDWQTSGLSRAILVSGDHGMVRDCRIEGYRKGGVVATGDYCTVQGCHLIRVRYYDGAPGLGSITGTTVTGMIITGNVITFMHNAGIGLANATSCIVQGNYIAGADWTVELGAVGSMGMNLVNSINRCIISHNVIERIANEGIILSSGGSGGLASDGNSIVGNIIKNTTYHAINLRAIGGNGATPHYCRWNTIVGNAIYANSMPGGALMAAGICFEADAGDDYVRYNLASGNIISGENGVLSRGVRSLGNSSNVSYNNINNNSITGATVVGIMLGGQYSNVNNNSCLACAIGIQSIFASFSRIFANIIDGSTTASIQLTGTPTRLMISENTIDLKIDTSLVVGSSWFLFNNTYSNKLSFGTATLVAGTVTINDSVFGAANSEAIVQLFRKTPAGTPANTGALYISNIEQGSNRFTVKSTNAADDGTFYWRLVR